jgi:hypothetical protein
MKVAGADDHLPTKPSGPPAGRPPTCVVASRRGGSAAGTGQPQHDLPAQRTGHFDMTRESSRRAESQRKPTARKYYIITYSLAHNRADFEVDNEEVLLMGALALYPPKGRRGFPDYPETPRVVIGTRKKGPPPSDLELFHSYWLISDQLKRVFEAVDGPAFAFQACDVRLSDGSPGPVYWLCDVVRVLDAFGEKTLAEIRRYRERTGNRYRGFIGDTTLVFNEEVIGDARIFRTPYSPGDVFCDQVMKDACASAGMKGVRFRKCFN